MKKLFTFLLCMCLTVSAFSQVVIYEIYGGGGNTGAIYKNDYIVLRNNGSTPVSLVGWSIQYASATSSSWDATNLVGSIAAGGYYLIQMYGNPGGPGAALPTPNVTAVTNASMNNINVTDGKIILSNSTTPETTANPSGANIQDKVGWGNTATAFEGSLFNPSPQITNAQSITRKNTGQDTNNNSVDFAKTIPNPINGPLPVELTYFQTQATDNQKINIKWETAMEINSSYFVLERSRDAINYKSIANIEAAGSSTSKKTYSFTDESALFGTNYYRLSQIDRDGTKQIFRPQAVVIDDANVAFGVFPNPTIGSNFSVKVEDSDEASLNLADFSGRVIGLNISKLTQTILEVTPSETLKFGIYILEVQTLGSLKKHKILVLK
jgi:hypothetical protein